MFRRLFVDHPKSVDENYVEHFGVAGRFGVDDDLGRDEGAGACSRPRLCITSGSDTVKRLNHIMVEQRRAKGQAVTEMLTVDWII